MYLKLLQFTPRIVKTKNINSFKYDTKDKEYHFFTVKNATKFRFREKLMDIDIKKDNLTTFKPTNINDINTFNPQENEQYLIKSPEHCPFTNKLEISTLKASVVDFLHIQDSKFNLSFCYISSYGIDTYMSFENVEIITKLG